MKKMNNTTLGQICMKPYIPVKVWDLVQALTLINLILLMSLLTAGPRKIWVCIFYSVIIVLISLYIFKSLYPVVSTRIILSEDGFTIRQGRSLREVLWNRISHGCEVHFHGSQWIILSTDRVIDQNESLQLITYHWNNRRTDFQANCRANNHLLVFCSNDYSPEQWHIFLENLVARNKLI